jgi:hypothetical protein
LCHLELLVLSILSTLSIPWKSLLMGSAIMSAKIGFFYKILLLLGVLSTCLDAVLCVLLADALVLIDWLAMLHFFELQFSFTLLSPAWAGRTSLAARYRSALSRSEFFIIVGGLFHDQGGTPWGHLSFS